MKSNPVITQFFKDAAKLVPKDKLKQLKELEEFYQSFMNGAAIDEPLQQVLFDWATINGYACVKLKSMKHREMLEKFVDGKMYPDNFTQMLFL